MSLAMRGHNGQSTRQGRLDRDAPHRRHSEGTMKSKHAGMTLISFLVLLLVVGFFAYMAMKLVPAYTEFMGVQKAMNDIATENFDGKSMAEIRNDLIKKMDYQYVGNDTITRDDITLAKGDQGLQLQVAYDKDIPFIYNIDFLVHFEKSVPIQGNVATSQ
jgi:Tfp pilus assembly major pilin PilA